MNGYVTLTTLKSRLGITGTSDDTQLGLLIDAMSRAVERYVHRHFYVKNEKRYFDGDGKAELIVPDLLSIVSSGLKMDTDLDTTYEEIIAATDYVLKPYNEWPKYIIALHPNGDYSYFTKGLKTLELDGAWGYGDGESATPYATSGTTVNTGNISNSALTHALATGKGALFEVGQTILIDTEQLYITAISTDTLTFTRGVNGTTAAAHTSGAIIYIYRYPEAVREATFMQASRMWKRKDTAFAQMLANTELGTMQVFRGLDPDVKMLLEDFVLPSGTVK